MAIVVVGNNTLGVVLVLDFHAGEAADVDIAAEVLASSESLLDAHIHIKSFVGLFLAVCDASLLLRGLRKLELIIKAVFVALCEQELSEGSLLE